MFDRVLLWCLAVFFVLYGLLHVTNVQVAWAPQLIGFAALVAGIICVVRAVK